MAYIDEFPELIKNDEFEIDGVRYKWMTLEQMEKAATIWWYSTRIMSRIIQIHGFYWNVNASWQVPIHTLYFLQ